MYMYMYVVCGLCVLSLPSLSPVSWLLAPVRRGPLQMRRERSGRLHGVDTTVSFPDSIPTD